MNEHSFIDSLHEKLPAAVYRWKINDPAHAGVADAFYSGPVGHVFVEYKFVALPARDKTVMRFGLSPLQINWLRARYLDNIGVACIIGTPRGAAILQRLEWERTWTRGEFATILQPYDCVVTWLVETCIGAEYARRTIPGRTPRRRAAKEHIYLVEGSNR